MNEQKKESNHKPHPSYVKELSLETVLEILKPPMAAPTFIKDITSEELRNSVFDICVEIVKKNNKELIK